MKLRRNTVFIAQIGMDIACLWNLLVHKIIGEHILSRVVDLIPVLSLLLLNCNVESDILFNIWVTFSPSVFYTNDK